MRKLLFISSLWVLVSGLVEAEPRKSLIVQAPVIEWHKGHGTDGGDHVHYGMQTSDGGYIMVGQTEKDRNGSDMLVVKTDAKGNLEWQKVKGQNRQAVNKLPLIESASNFDQERDDTRQHESGLASVACSHN